MDTTRSPLDLGNAVRTFSITTEIGKSRLTSFPKFLLESSEKGKFGTIAAGNFSHVAGEGGKFLLFDARMGGAGMPFSGGMLQRSDYSARVRMRLDSPLFVEIFSYQGDNERFARRLEDYLLLALQFFEEALRNDTVYFSMIPGSERTSRLLPKQNFLQRLFTGNMLNLFLLFILIGFILILTLGPMIAPIVLVTLMLTIVLSAGKLMAIRSDWRITEEHREIAIVEYSVDSSLIPGFVRRYESILPSIKREIYEHFTFDKGEVHPSDIVHIMSKYGINATEDQILIKRINVHDIVSRAAERFNMPIPTVIVTRNLKPNAAATGFSKHLATMLITLGLLVQLDKREIELVVGHELSHLRFGDPAILFSIVSVEYLLRVYVFYSYVVSFSLFYLVFIFWLIFFFGKFLETRADLEAALMLRDPSTMATSLKKIGFRKLALDKRFIEGKESSVGDWLAFDPHPPIGFRIRRLENIDLEESIKHTFLRSVGDVFRGIRRAIRS